MVAAAALLHGASLKEFTQSYASGEYKKACKTGIVLFNSGEKDEHVISAVGDACMKVDYINILGGLQKYQRTTKQARSNAVVFTTLLLQKRLLYQFMYDNVSLRGFEIPSVGHIISIVFNAVQMGNYEVVQNSPKVIETRFMDRLYRVYLSKVNKGRLSIDEIEDGKVIQTHRYF